MNQINVTMLCLHISLSHRIMSYEIKCIDRVFVGHVPDPVDFIAELYELISKESIDFINCFVRVTTDMDCVDKKYLKASGCMYPDKICILKTEYEKLNQYCIHTLPVQQYCRSFFDLYLNAVRYIKTIQENL